MRSVQALWREERRVALVLRRPPAGWPGRRRRLRRADAARLRAHRLGVGRDRGDARRPASRRCCSARCSAASSTAPAASAARSSADVVRASAFAGLMLRRRHRADDRARPRCPASATPSSAPRPPRCCPRSCDGAHLTPANALYGMVRDVGQLVGPACAAGLLLPRLARARARPQRRHVRDLRRAARCACAATSARCPPRRTRAEERSTLAGIGTVVRDPVVRTLMGCSGAVVLAAGSINVGELVLAQQDLGAGQAGFALLVSAYGLGLIGGSLLGAGNDGEAGLRRRYLAGHGADGRRPHGLRARARRRLRDVQLRAHRRRQRPVHRQRPRAAPAHGPGAPPRPRVRRPRLGRGLGLRRRRARRRRAREHVRRPRHLRGRRRRHADRPDRREPRAVDWRRTRSASLRPRRRRRASRAGSRGTAPGAACRR